MSISSSFSAPSSFMQVQVLGLHLFICLGVKGGVTSVESSQVHLVGGLLFESKSCKKFPLKRDGTLISVFDCD